MLGALALAARDTATALVEYGLARETDPTDVELYPGHGKALRSGHHLSEAAAELRRAIALEPSYAELYFALAAALEDSGDKTGAAAAYGQFLSRSTQFDPRRSVAEQKVQVLKER
jgi:Flp pilus assembly protein TadD